MFLKVKALQPQNLGHSKVEFHRNLGKKIGSKPFLSVT